MNKRQSEERALQVVIEYIWKTYDNDNSGYLNKDQTRAFFTDTLTNLGCQSEFCEKAFQEVFDTLDIDNCGNIDQEEMKIFIKRL